MRDDQLWHPTPAKLGSVEVLQPGAKSGQGEVGSPLDPERTAGGGKSPLSRQERKILRGG